jgi:hypothetical protein
MKTVQLYNGITKTWSTYPLGSKIVNESFAVIYRDSSFTPHVTFDSASKDFMECCKNFKGPVRLVKLITVLKRG